MNRRQILQYTARIIGAAVSAPLTAALLSGCSKPGSDPVATGAGVSNDLPFLHFFSPDQFRKVKHLADTILPGTDSPSASAVNVHITMDSMLGQVFNEEQKSRFTHSWQALERHLDQKDFMRKNTSRRTEILSTLELSKGSEAADARRGLIDFKQQVIEFYLTTEEVSRNFLNYLPIPGSYSPCISIDDVSNRAWAI